MRPPPHKGDSHAPQIFETRVVFYSLTLRRDQTHGDASGRLGTFTRYPLTRTICK